MWMLVDAVTVGQWRNNPTDIGNYISLKDIKCPFASDLL